MTGTGNLSQMVLNVQVVHPYLGKLCRNGLLSERAVPLSNGLLVVVYMGRITEFLGTGRNSYRYHVERGWV